MWLCAGGKDAWMFRYQHKLPEALFQCKEELDIGPSLPISKQVELIHAHVTKVCPRNPYLA